MIGSVEVRCTAHRPNQPLAPIFTYVGSPSNMRIIDVPKGIGQFSVDVVRVVVDYPNNKKEIVEAVRQGSVYIATIPACEISGKTIGGVEIICDCTDEHGNPVEGFVIGKGDVFVLERDSKFSKLIEKFYVKWSDELPTNPAKGDLIYHNGDVRLFNGSEWLTLGIDPQIIEGIDNRINEVESSIPTKTSQLENDSGFISGGDIPTKTSQLVNDSDFSTNASVDEKIGGVTSSIPTKVSQLQNDSGFITVDDVPTKTSELVNDSDFATNASVDEKIESVSSSIPTKTSQLENDSGFLTQHQSLSNYYTKTETDEAISSSVSSKVDAKYIESEDGKKRIFGNGEVSVLSSTPEVYGPWTDANGNTRTDLQVKLVDPNVPTYVWGNDTLSFFSVAFNSREEAETATEFEEAIPNRGYRWTRSYTPSIDIWVKEGELATKTYVDNAIGNVLTQEEF